MAYRDEAENASELMPGQEDASAVVGNNTLHVSGNDIRMHIHNFADAYVPSYSSSNYLHIPTINIYRRRADIQNEQIPTFTYASRPSSPADPRPYPLVTTPSMRRGSGDSDTSVQIEDLIKKTLEEDDDQDVVEKLADRIAGLRKVTGRPRALKRFETA